MTQTSPNVETKSAKVETAALTRLLFVDDMTSVSVLYQLVLSAHELSRAVGVVGCIQYYMCAPHENTA
jgi:hypothetical protein